MLMPQYRYHFPEVGMLTEGMTIVFTFPTFLTFLTFFTFFLDRCKALSLLGKLIVFYT